MKNLTVFTVLLGVSLSANASTLWFGNDDRGTEFHTTLTGSALGTINQYMTGVAWDGTTLYTSASNAGLIQTRSLDGTPSGGSFVVPAAAATEDMAWDSRRNRLVRLEHDAPALQRFTTTGAIDGDFALPTADPNNALTPLGALGVAYDSQRDEYDISFCQAGCSNLHAGIVMAFDAATLAPHGVLFSDAAFLLVGLAYDPLSDSLWLGAHNAAGQNTVQNRLRDGTILTSFNISVVADGMEFVQTVPLPGGLGRWGTAIGLLGLVRRRKAVKAHATGIVPAHRRA